jgi:hypothetical protein
VSTLLRIRADFPLVAFVQFRDMAGNSRLIIDYSAQPTTALVRVFRAIKAGALYAVIVFPIGFILGTIRVLLLAPRLGDTPAVIMEVPVMLAASWFVCRWCVYRLDMRRTVPDRSLMGLVAFLVLMTLEVGLGAAFGRSLVDQLAAYTSPPGAIGLAAQVIFATFPVTQIWRRCGHFRPAKFRRSLDRQFLVRRIGKRLPGNKEKGRKTS